MQGPPGAGAPEGRPRTSPADVDLPLDRDRFFRGVIGGLAGTLEDITGLGEAEGFVSVVGDAVGAELNDAYRAALGEHRFDRDTLAEVLVDLKRRIGGGFRVVDTDDDTIVLHNTACPFGSRVEGHPSLCMMTANVFGRIAADHASFAAVTLAETIALGHGRCVVHVQLAPGPGPEGHRREFFADSPLDAPASASPPAPPVDPGPDRATPPDPGSP